VDQVFGVGMLLACVVASCGSQENPADHQQRTKLEQIVSTLQLFWGKEFDGNYRKYMLGSSPIVVLIPRAEMIQIAKARLDGKRRDGEVTQGLTINDERIFVVYDDIAPLFVAQTISHEIGHLQLRSSGLSRNDEEARVRKIVDTAFFAKVLGRHWLESTIGAIEKKTLPVEKHGRIYNGHTPQAVAEVYERLKKAGVNVERNRLHDRILETVVFILTNTEEDLSAALAADDP
jgi:hypothetical protein